MDDTPLFEVFEEALVVAALAAVVPAPFFLLMVVVVALAAKIPVCICKRSAVHGRI